MEVADISTASREALKRQWKLMFDCEAPARVGRSTLSRILICELQWQGSGETRRSYERQLKRLLVASPKPTANAGARLIREWNGKEHVVDVTEEGYLWNGKAWRSLSAIAKEITGTKWSGPRFFGVKT